MTHYDKNTLEKAKQYVLSFYEASADFVEPYFQDFLNDYKDYKCYMDTTEDDYKYLMNTVFVPLAFRFIETATSKVLNMLFKTSKLIGVEGQTKESETTAKYVEHHLNFVYTNRINMFEKLHTCIKTNLMYGTTYGITSWLDHRPTIKTRQPVKMGKIILGYKDVARRVTLQHNPNFTPKDVFSIYPDPRATTVGGARGNIDSYYVDLDVFLDSVKDDKDYFNLDLLEKINAPVGNMWRDWRSEKANAIGMTTKGLGTAPIDKDKFVTELTVLDYWGLYEFIDEVTGKKKLQQGIITLVNGEIIVRMRATPYYHQQSPLLKVVDTLDPYEWFGRGIGKIIRGFQKYINKSTNQRLDNLDLALNVMWLVTQGNVDDFSQLVSRPSGIIEVGDINGIKALEPSKISIDSIREYKVLKDEAEQSVGVPSYTMGVPSTRLNDTATGVTAIIQQAMDKFATKIFMYAKNLIEPKAYLDHALTEQYMESKEVIRIVGKEYLDELKIKPVQGEIGFLEIEPWQVIGRYNFKCMTNALEQPIALKQERLLRFAQIATSEGNARFIRPMELLKQIAEMLEVPETKKVFKEPEEIQKEEEQRQEMALKMESMKRGGGGGGGTLAKTKIPEAGTREEEIRKIGAALGGSGQ